MALAKHKSVPKDLKRLMKRVEAHPQVKKVVLQETEPCRHRYAHGTIRVLGETQAGLRLNGYFQGGVIRFFLVCDEKAAVRAWVDKNGKE